MGIVEHEQRGKRGEKGRKPLPESDHPLEKTTDYVAEHIGTNEQHVRSKVETELLQNTDNKQRIKQHYTTDNFKNNSSATTNCATQRFIETNNKKVRNAIQRWYSETLSGFLKARLPSNRNWQS